MPHPVRIAPSVLAADFSHLGEDVRAVTLAGADLIHLDVMYGHFVPNLTFGPAVIKSIRPYSDKPFDAHLMVKNPDDVIQMFIDAGCDMMTVHPDTCADPIKTLQNIRTAGLKAGVAFNPETPIDTLKNYLPFIDIVLIMTVSPGFGGQAFQPLYNKIATARTMIDGSGLTIDISVDGGVKSDNASDIINAGANILVAGTAIFHADDYAAAINALRIP